MKRALYLIFLLLVTLAGCNLGDDRKLSDAEAQALAQAKADSIKVVFDSLSAIPIFVPPLYDEKGFDAGLVQKFYDLAKETGGELKVLANARLLTQEIIHILQKHSTDGADLLLLIDKTSSMMDDIDQLQAGLIQIIDAIQDHAQVRLAIALYGDKNTDGDQWFSYQNFEQNYSAAKSFVSKIEVTGGGDTPESVYDGFFKTMDKHFWRSSTKRMVILLGDAAPLEKPLSKYSLDDVVQKAMQEDIKMNFYPIVVKPFSEEYDLTGGVVDYEEAEVISKMYPNPTPGPVRLDFDSDGKHELQVFNSSGELVLSEVVDGPEWSKDLSALASGAYMIRAIDASKRFATKRLIIQK